MAPTDDLNTLGATLGGAQRRRGTFRSRLKVMQGMRRKFATMHEPEVELKLARHGLGERKAQHLLRMYGAELLPELAQADTPIDATLNIIPTGMIDISGQQASLGIRITGLGLRRLKDLATPAELAAKLPAHPKIAEMPAALTTVGLTPDNQLLKHLDVQHIFSKMVWRLSWT